MLTNMAIKVESHLSVNRDRNYPSLSFPGWSTKISSKCVCNILYVQFQWDRGDKKTRFGVLHICIWKVLFKWKCFTFSAEHTPAFVNLIAPKYVKTNEKFLLDCSSSITPINFTAHIFVNGLLYTKLQRQSNGCWSSTKHSLCSEPACECSSDGHTYSVEYNGLPYEGTLTFSCLMDLPDVGLISDCKFVRICGKPDNVKFVLIHSCLVFMSEKLKIVFWNC